jgi:hypothetical protein
MARRFTLAELLLWVTLAALVLALIVPMWRALQRASTDMVTAVAASADGSTFGALLGEGKVLVWDDKGTLKATLPTRGDTGGHLALSFDGRLAAVSTGWQQTGPQRRDGIELWDVGSAKLLKSVPASFMGRPAFSPDQKMLAVVEGHSVDLHTLADGTHLGTIAVGGNCGVFSPDGQMIAVATPTNGVQTYRALTQERARQFETPSDRISWYYFDVAWSPDGQALASLCSFTDDGLQTIQTWQVDGSQPHSETLSDEDSFESLTYLPGGRLLAVTGLRSGMMVLDAATLDQSTAKRIEGVSMAAAGPKGDVFLTAGIENVGLRDVATLKPRQQLFEAAPFPNIFPALAGLAAWLVWFGIRRARRFRRSCQTCGQPFQPNNRKDTSVDCLACRQTADAKRLTPTEAARRQRRLQRQGWRVLLLLDGLIAVLVALAAGARFGFWPAFVVTAALLPPLLIGFLFAWVRWRLLRAANATRDFASADEAAGSPGVTRQVGKMRVWSAQGTSLAGMLEAEAEIARQRLAAAIGCAVPAPTARAFFFEDGEMVVRYLGRFGVQIAPRLRQKSLYVRAPSRRLAVAERPLREGTSDPYVTLRWLVTYHLLEAVEGRAPPAWMNQGLAAALSHDDEYHELARLNRRVMAGFAAGRTIGAAKFFGTTANRIWEKHTRHELDHFAWSNQFTAQAWSLMEFLCGRGATDERRRVFQTFFNDADRGKRPAQAIERHLGGSCEELLARWRKWVDGRGIGEHCPPPKHVADYLLAGPIARLGSGDTLPGDRVAAIRELGEQGYLLGADRLIGVLREDNEDLCAEAVWALECISGRVLGSSPSVWEQWWEGLTR